LGVEPQPKLVVAYCSQTVGPTLAATGRIQTTSQRFRLLPNHLGSFYKLKMIRGYSGPIASMSCRGTLFQGPIN